MTPKEKAKNLLDKYKTYVVMRSGGVEVERENVKQCALIAVEEIIISLPIKGDIDISRWWWRQVKEEIEKL